MIKKAALIVFTFSALVGAHLAYVQAFAFVADQLARNVEDGPTLESESLSKVRSNQLARDNFGEGHWSTQTVKLSYYDASRGSYMYAQDYTLSDDSKRMTVTPFAMVAVSKDGRSFKTVTADKAIIDMNQPYGLVRKSSEPQHVTHAQLIGNVRIRDDKGTHDDRGDDMLIGPMTHIEYDEKTLRISTTSDVVIQDQDMMITGAEMMIQLRKKVATDPRPGGGGGGGFGGGFEAETAFLYRNVHIRSSNVGSGGVLMGKSRPDKKGQTPLDLWCAGQMRVDMPKPVVEVVVGPPNPYREPEPTYARFEKDVKVVRGVDQLDQLNSDMLFLTLRPDTKRPRLAIVEGEEAAPSPASPAPAVAATPANAEAAKAEGKGSLSGLKLRTALAQGHAVWVQSESQGLKARCAELRYEKLLDQGKPDKTYLNGGSSRKLQVEKVDYYAEGPNAGSIKSVMELVAFDATILDSGPGSNSEILARGPGKVKERPNRGASVEREGWFEEQLKVVNFREPAAPGAAAAAGPVRRQVTLTGPATKLVDHKQKATLEAEEKIVAEFESTPSAAPAAGGKGGDGPTRIKWLRAYNNVHMTTVGRTLTAWKKLEAIFVEPAPTAKPAPAAGTGPALAAAAAPPPPAATLGPIVAANEGGEPAAPEPKPEEPPAKLEPAVDGRANFVLAHIIPGAGNGGKSEVRDATLRGGVIVHQDPAPGEAFGRDAKGEALDLYSLGKGLMRFVVAAEDPQAANPEARGRLAADLGTARAQLNSPARLAARSRQAAPRGFAQVEFDGKVVTSRHLIGLDQRENFAWCVGEGSMEQVADRGLLDDKGLDSDRAKAKTKAKGESGPAPRDRMTITWNEEMRFYGRSRDKADREVAKAEFRGPSELMQVGDGRREFRRGVEAKMTDAAIFADTMDVYMDKPIDLSRAAKGAPGAPKADPNAPKPPAEPQAEIAMIEAWGDDAYRPDNDQPYAGVDVTSRKFFPGTKVLKEKQRIQHTHIIYDKRTGDFEGSGAGMAFLYQGKLPPGADKAAARPGSGHDADAPAPTIKLTQIRFNELVKGRFGVARDSVEAGPRTAEFVGNVQAADAVVANDRSGLDFDRLDGWRDAIFLSSDVLRVRSEPLPAGSNPANRQMMFAQGNAAAKTIDRLIQGDRITYDSTDQKTFAYGDDGKEVSLVEQKSPGQPPSTTRGTSLMYNNRTKQFDFNNPQSIQMYDLKTGSRPKALYPDLGGSPKKFDPIKQKRLPIPKPQRSSAERKSFSGGQ